MDLEYRFATTYSLLCLHVWLILVRLRAEGKDGRALAQMMYENFQEDVELRVRAEGVKVRSQGSKLLTLFAAFGHLFLCIFLSCPYFCCLLVYFSMGPHND